jgi:hypothetical protein
MIQTPVPAAVPDLAVEVSHRTESTPRCRWRLPWIVMALAVVATLVELGEMILSAGATVSWTAPA